MLPRMYLLFIESNTTGSGMQALMKARELNLEPVLFTRNQEQYHGLKATKCRVVSSETNDLVLLRRSIRDFLSSAPGKVGGITSLSEFYLETSCLLASEAGFPTNSLEMTQNCRDKVRTRQILFDAGLPQPRYLAVNQVNDIKLAVEHIGLPCIVKPSNDTSSYGVKLCNSMDEAVIHATQLLQQITNIRGQKMERTVLCEEYIDASEFSVETFAWQGEISCVGITEKRLTGFPYFVEAGHIFPASLPTTARNMIVNTTREALKILGNSYGPMHTEVKLTDKECIIIEINARLAGGMIPELIWQAKGIDLVKNQVRVACGQPPILTPARSSHAGIIFLTAPASGKFVSIRGLDSLRTQFNIVQVTITKPLGQYVLSPQSAYDRLGYIIIRVDSYTALVEQLEKIQKGVEIVVDLDYGPTSLVPNQDIL